jgi:hypothetical protein
MNPTALISSVAKDHKTEDDILEVSNITLTGQIFQARARLCMLKTYNIPTIMFNMYFLHLDASMLISRIHDF